MAPHSSTLARKIPWAEEPGRLQSMGSQEGRRGSDEVVPGTSMFPSRETRVSGNFWWKRQPCPWRCSAVAQLDQSRHRERPLGATTDSVNTSRRAVPPRSPRQEFTKVAARLLPVHGARSRLLADSVSRSTPRRFTSSITQRRPISRLCRQTHNGKEKICGATGINLGYNYKP